MTYLHRLSAAAGIIPWYLDQTGKEKRVATDETRIALLAAMGLEAETEARARDALRRLSAERRRELIAPVRVVEASDPSLRDVHFRPPPRVSAGRWRLTLVAESGEPRTAEGSWDDSMKSLRLPVVPRQGYHEVHVSFTAAGREWTADQMLAVVPSRCTPPEELLGGRTAFGLVANLYTVRSAQNWGVGDLADLRHLLEWTGELGGDFVGVNPLHALLNRGHAVSPYSPVSRLFRNPLYLDVEEVPELRHEAAAEAAERIASPEFCAQLDALRAEPRVRYDQVMAVKGLALDALHRVFAAHVRDGDSERARAYRAYVAAQEPELTRFATWMALAQGAGGRAQGAGVDAEWSEWESELRDPESPAVARFAEQHAERVDFHRWVQFELDRQIADAQASARAHGLGIGLYQDLAIGTSPAGADTWIYPGLFARGAYVGAPPDPYSAVGQNWGLPPINPRALRHDRYRYYLRLLRSGFRHAGALRIDHVIGLFRMFWIPQGHTGMDGAYVRYPSADLLGLLALESARHRALVVGEDLGTVPKEVPPALEKWGILSSKVMVFERTPRGAFRPADEYPRLALTTANTHDMAPIAGFWSGADIALREDAGLIHGDGARERVEASRAKDRRSLLRRLFESRVLPSAREPKDAAELRGAVHEWLCRSPSVLVGIALDDLAGESEQVNLPGVGLDRFPSWSRKMRMSLEEMRVSPEVRTALRCARRARHPPN